MERKITVLTNQGDLLIAGTTIAHGNTILGVVGTPVYTTTMATAIKPQREVAWMIEKCEKHAGFTTSEYLCLAGEIPWSNDPAKGLRFSRKIDAEKFAAWYLKTGSYNITEHIMMGL